MIDRLREIIHKAKYLTMTITDQGDQVQITATVRPKDGSDPAKPIQVKADWQIADALLVEALHEPPKPGKTKVQKDKPKAEADSGDLFAAAEAEKTDSAKVGQVGPVGQVGQTAGTEAAEQKADDESKTKTEEK